MDDKDTGSANRSLEVLVVQMICQKYQALAKEIAQLGQGQTQTMAWASAAIVASITIGLVSLPSNPIATFLVYLIAIPIFSMAFFSNLIVHACSSLDRRWRVVRLSEAFNYLALRMAEDAKDIQPSGLADFFKQDGQKFMFEKDMFLGIAERTTTNFTHMNFLMIVVVSIFWIWAVIIAFNVPAQQEIAGFEVLGLLGRGVRVVLIAIAVGLSVGAYWKVIHRQLADLRKMAGVH